MNIQDLTDLIQKANDSVKANKELLEAYSEALQSKVKQVISAIEKEYGKPFNLIPPTKELTMLACNLYDELQSSI